MKLSIISAFIIIFTLLSSCEFIQGTLSFKGKVEDFVESVKKKEYNKAVSQMALESEMGKNINIDTLKLGFVQFREVLVQNFGTDKFEYSLIKSEKKSSSVEGEGTPPNTTLALVEFSNANEIGAVQVLFDDKSKKIINIKTLDVKRPKPQMLLFWLFGLFPMAVLIFNIYVFRKIKQSTLRRKWTKYVAVIVLNVPTIYFSPVDGLSVQYFYFQILFGASFTLAGYLGSSWAFGIPFGSLYGLWKLKKHQEAEKYEAEIQALYSHDDLENPKNESENNENPTDEKEEI